MSFSRATELRSDEMLYGYMSVKQTFQTIQKGHINECFMLCYIFTAYNGRSFLACFRLHFNTGGGLGTISLSSAD